MTDEKPTVQNGGMRPVPDPTVLTDAAIARSEKAMRDYVDGQIAIRDERLKGIDEATRLLRSTTDDTPIRIDEKVGNLERLHAERFESVAQRFTERDIRSEREARDNKVAVDAAFAAQKEAAAKQDEANAKAIDKSERATAETIKTNQELSLTKIDALEKNLTDLKLVVGAIGASKQGATENRTGLYAGIAAFGGILGILISAGVLIASTH